MRRQSRARLALALLLASAVVACAARTGGAGQPLTEDERIGAEVQRIIADIDELAADDLTVETDGGVVTITGVQTELEPVSEMLRRVARIRGVSEVVNRVRIVRGSQPR